MAYGSSDELVRLMTWDRATRPAPPHSPNEWRFDPAGHPIRFSAYGDRSSPYGWELDHFIPASAGGPDGPHNRIALCWRCNVAKSDSVPRIGKAIASLRPKPIASLGARRIIGRG